MRHIFYWAGCLAACMGMPLLSRAQDTALSTGIGGLQTVLDQLYTSMLPMCGQLIGTGQALAGLAALGYIGIRVGKHISRAEAVDVFPLLRPFAIGIIIFLYTDFIGGINAVLSPVVNATDAMVTGANASIATLLQQKEAALQGSTNNQLYAGPDGSGNETLWQLYAGASPADPVSMLTTAFSFQLSKSFFNLKNMIKVWLSEVLEIVYEAAALCINTLRTFNLIVLAILGPIVLGLSVFDVFRHSLSTWLARYVNVFLWLPVANIFGAIIATVQAQMIRLDIQQIRTNGSTYFSSGDIAYLIFLLIGILGYFVVPSVAGYIVQAAGGDALIGKVGKVVRSSGEKVVRAGAAILGAA
ncbi:MAG TPA: conjugative transposon protein TraJ [Puia sp.]|nr:conjugative transposon protein TraJ [Puia sp.]